MKIPSAAEQRQTYLAQLQPHIDEPILAVGFLASAGYAAGLTKDYAAAGALRTLSPIAGRLFRKQQVSARVDAARNDLVAVTAHRVHLFEFPKRGEAFAVTGPPDVWNRSEIRVTAEAKGKYAQLIHVAFADGETRDYDISNGARDYATFSDDMRDLLLAPVTV
ncbi:hypothetical protein [Aquihabitans sp. McL0605]|uniref:hypothetical protein n=1 Tax=Aquihabitans sp. McL0605 TaxID=3415671 RepID=UPI003CF88C70